MQNKLTEMIKTGIGGSLPKATAEKLAPKIAESLIRSGKVVVLPCEKKTEVWCLVTPCGNCEEEELTLRGLEHCQKCEKLVIEKLPFDLEMVDEWGKYVFPTEDEAKQALKKKVKKMTDNEVIKALKCCAESVTKKACKICPFKDKGKVRNLNCLNLEKYTLDLINRQKEEIEELRKRIVFWKEYMNYQPEKERAEAIKEFAERLKCGVPQETGVIRCKNIDELVKEFEGN